MAAFGANVGIAITKLVAFLVTGSASMLAEFVHSVADCSDQILLLVGRNRANRAETVEHPFGFGRERFFYGFLVSVVLFSVGGAYSVYDGIRKIIHPGTLTSPYVAFGVLFISAILEGFSLRTAIKESNPERNGTGWGSFIRRAKGPDLIVVLLEDSAALIGLAFAFAGVGLSVLTHNEAWDGGGSVAIGLLLACVAVVVARETKSLLIGEAASPAAEGTIVRALEDGPEVERVIHMRTVHLSPDSLLVAAKVAVRAGDSATTVVRGIDAAESRVRAAVPEADVIYLEPDLYQEARADETDPAIRVVQRALEHTGERGEQPAPSQPGSPRPAGPSEPTGPDPSALPARWGS
ncbi:MAG: cation diffusion facilitator family transporter [Streptosporangiaceae bacterium]